MQISRKVYARFLRRYQYPTLQSVPVLGHTVSGMQYLDDNGKVVVSMLSEKIAGIVSLSYYYHRNKTGLTKTSFNLTINNL